MLWSAGQTISPARTCVKRYALGSRVVYREWPEGLFRTISAKYAWVVG